MLEAVAVCPGKVCAAMCGQNAKLTVTVERIDGGKLRCTGATWTDAVIIFPGEVLAFQNIERQAHALRAPAPGGVVQTPRRHPRFGEDDFEAAPDEGAIPLSFYCPAERDAVVVLLPASPDLGEVISRPSRRSGPAPPRCR
jgi:hypothetical protein